MSLLSDIKAHYEGGSHYPPDGEDVDAEQVSRRYGESRRWGMGIEIVYRRIGTGPHNSDEYVAVSDVEPATEMQDWGDYGQPDIYEVRPVEITTIKYEKV